MPNPDHGSKVGVTNIKNYKLREHSTGLRPFNPNLRLCTESINDRGPNIMGSIMDAHSETCSPLALRPLREAFPCKRNDHGPIGTIVLIVMSLFPSGLLKTRTAFNGDVLAILGQPDSIRKV